MSGNFQEILQNLHIKQKDEMSIDNKVKELNNPLKFGEGLK